MAFIDHRDEALMSHMATIDHRDEATKPQRPLMPQRDESSCHRVFIFCIAHHYGLVHFIVKVEGVSVGTDDHELDILTTTSTFQYMEHLAQTAPQVYQGFLDGDFVAKQAKHSFNKVPFDLCLEHINKTGKVAGGLIGMTRNETARNRWSITYNERASLAQDTRSLFGLTHDGEDDEDNHKD
ncbi:hypothetical protein PO909_027594 [Leuciscus waleckii]